jgi:hypothetical protein
VCREIIHLTHWLDVPAANWRWRNFSPAEVAYRCTESLRIN